MRILALETSETAGSVAALEGDTLLAELQLDPTLRSARSLAPAIAQLLEQVGWASSAVELVAVTRGPGSFTGLRIGVTTAKAFAYGVGCQVVGVNTLEVIAGQAKAAALEVSGGAGGRSCRIWAAIDAQRQQFFVAQFAVSADAPTDRLICTEPTHLVDQQSWLSALQPGDVISGPGLARLTLALPTGVVAMRQDLWRPMATAVGRLGNRVWHSSEPRATPMTLVPEYFRRTAAEEQWERRGEAAAARETGPK